MSKNELAVLKIRKKFPIFTTKVHGYPFIFFDSASTAQVPQVVIDAMVAYYACYKSNIGRGIYAYAEQATKQYEQVRLQVADFIGAKPEEIIFTSGATGSINTVVQAWATQHIKTGDEIIVSEVEHHANFVPWQQFALKKGAVIKIVPVNERGVIDPVVFQSYLSTKTKLVALVHQSNILGTTNDVATLVQAAHARGARVLIDAAQSIAHQVIDVKKIDCDFLVFSGHKLFGPTGVGALYLKENIVSSCELTAFGGGMVYSVNAQSTQCKIGPQAFEPGTQPIAQVIGLGAAISFVQHYLDYALLKKHETKLVKRFIAGLKKIDGITLISPIPLAHEHNNMVTFMSEKYHAHDIAHHLDAHGIAVRAGHHCVQPYHAKIGVHASVRVSFSAYNTIAEVDFCLQQLQELLSV